MFFKHLTHNFTFPKLNACLKLERHSSFVKETLFLFLFWCETVPIFLNCATLNKTDLKENELSLFLNTFCYSTYLSPWKPNFVSNKPRHWRFLRRWDSSLWNLSSQKMQSISITNTASTDSAPVKSWYFLQQLSALWRWSSNPRLLQTMLQKKQWWFFTASFCISAR